MQAALREEAFRLVLLQRVEFFDRHRCRPSKWGVVCWFAFASIGHSWLQGLDASAAKFAAPNPG